MSATYLCRLCEVLGKFPLIKVVNVPSTAGNLTIFFLYDASANATLRFLGMLSDHLLEADCGYVIFSLEVHQRNQRMTKCSMVFNDAEAITKSLEQIVNQQ